MDNQLIDNCHVIIRIKRAILFISIIKLQEVDGDLSINTGTWTLKEFYAQFSDLYSWLNSVQETIYGKEENITDKALRAVCIQSFTRENSPVDKFVSALC